MRRRSRSRQQQTDITTASRTQVSRRTNIHWVRRSSRLGNDGHEGVRRVVQCDGCFTCGTRHTCLLRLLSLRLQSPSLAIHSATLPLPAIFVVRPSGILQHSFCVHVKHYQPCRIATPLHNWVAAKIAQRAEINRPSQVPPILRSHIIFQAEQSWPTRPTYQASH